MARFALGLQVFIASPADVQEEREKVEDAVMSLAPSAARDDLLLNVYRFEKDAVPAYGRPLDQSNVDLQASELVIAILGKGIGSPSRLGSTQTGTLEEIEVAERLVRAGRTDDLFLYYRTLDAGQPVPSVASTILPIIESRKQTVWPYTDTAHLAALVARHVKRWLDNWYGIPEICRHAFERSELALEREMKVGENRLDSLLRAFDLDHCQQCVPKPLGDLAVKLYQQHGPSAATLALPRELAALTPFVLASPDKGVQFAHTELFFLACASGLLDAILRQDSKPAERKPYINQIHQYLAALVHRTSDIQTVSNILCNWLSRRSGIHAVRPTARNFAAYVLGMIGAHDSTDQLAESLIEDSGEQVRLYCITSLGKLRSRKHVPMLRSAYKDSRYPAEQMMIAKSICRIIGVARYEL